MIWVVNANTNLCHIYEYQKKPANLTLLKEMSHPENRLKKEDYFTTDKPGHYRSDNMGSGGSYSPHSDPKEVEINNFAREIAEKIDAGRNQHLFENFILISPPHMSGLLLKHFNKHVKGLMTHHIQKDVQYLKLNELLDFLKTHASYPE